ncbi:hypothetical protein [Thioalkalivibrio sp. ALMg11]|uniref:hypothetical protein n=1 Tax=Thioalkalivibrio sp. ALMg11 TaxID=1158165 RepID=UPI00039D06B0|nr:hypothetical protein [Thioalkalivibrio sp. ALMg11]
MPAALDFPYPLHFLAPSPIRDFIDSSATVSLDDYPGLFHTSSWAWIGQTAFELRKYGLDVSTGEDYRPGAINFGLAADIRRRPVCSEIFKVSLDADQLRPRWANLSFVQNQRQTSRCAFWVPHWPQPGLVRRDSSRAEFRTVGFFGLERNLCRDPEWWRHICAAYGMEFRLKTAAEWNDYHDIDVAVGVRDFSCKKHDEKPPTKMFNAWLAGAVFIGGCDSAYSQVGKDGRDFLRCATEQDLSRYLGRLQRDPEWGRDVVRTAAESVSRTGSRASTVERWVELIEREVGPRFEAWQRASELVRRLSSDSGRFQDWTIRVRNSSWRLLKTRVRRR